jgi:hypothetical protein
MKFSKDQYFYGLIWNLFILSVIYSFTAILLFSGFYEIDVMIASIGSLAVLVFNKLTKLLTKTDLYLGIDSVSDRILWISIPYSESSIDIYHNVLALDYFNSSLSSHLLLAEFTII